MLEDLSYSERRMLESIFRISKRGVIPDAKSIHQESGCLHPEGKKIKVNYINNLVGKLRNKGYLINIQREVRLSEEGKRIIKEMERIAELPIFPISLPVRGQVKAGPPESDELKLEFDQSEKEILIMDPALKTAYAVEVVGDSMKEEGILEGDYVIVEEFDDRQGETPKIGELIVTHYIPPLFDLEDIYIDESYLRGPTLKFYYHDFIGNNRIIRLSWRKGHKDSEHTILAREIRPIGRVVGVFRPKEKL